MTNNIQNYNKLIEKFLIVQKNKDYDNEKAHIMQDKIYKKFIKELSANKFKTIEEAIIISKQINKFVVKYDKDRWYA